VRKLPSHTNEEENEMSELNDDPYLIAEQLGKVVVLPDPDELFIDIDSQEGLDTMFAMMSVAADAGIRINEKKRLPSKTPGHWHVYLTIQVGAKSFTVTKLLRVALQACLGSDRKRELLSLAKIMHHIERPPTVFFENPLGGV
jgi:hypothetical protein